MVKCYPSENKKMFSKVGIEQYFIAKKQESVLFLAIGIGAIILTLGTDYFAEKRGHEYLNGLRAFTEKSR